MCLCVCVSVRSQNTAGVLFVQGGLLCVCARVFVFLFFLIVFLPLFIFRDCFSTCTPYVTKINLSSW